MDNPQTHGPDSAGQEAGFKRSDIDIIFLSNGDAVAAHSDMSMSTTDLDGKIQVRVARIFPPGSVRYGTDEWYTAVDASGNQLMRINPRHVVATKHFAERPVNQETASR